MKKSPLSTPGGTFHHGRGRNRGYGYNSPRNNRNNFHRFTCPNPNDSSSNQIDNDMIPLGTSSPIYRNNRQNRGFHNNFIDRNQRFPNAGTSGSYNNQRNNYQNNSSSPYSPQKYQRFNKQNNNPHWYSQLPILEFIDIKSMFEDPWADLVNKLQASKNEKDVHASIHNNSVEIILEKHRLNSSLESNSSEGTINISSSCDEIKDGSSVDLHLESMNFSRDSEDNSVPRDSVTSKDEFSFCESTNESQNDSVIEISQ